MCSCSTKTVILLGCTASSKQQYIMGGLWHHVWCVRCFIKKMNIFAPHCNKSASAGGMLNSATSVVLEVLYWQRVPPAVQSSTSTFQTQMWYIACAPDVPWCPLSLLSSALIGSLLWGHKGMGMKLTTCLHVVPGLLMYGAISPLQHIILENGTSFNLGTNLPLPLTVHLV
jgi:hypothetical protein